MKKSCRDELKMINRFYDEYFSLRAYLKNHKPSPDHVTTFALCHGWDNLDHNRNILALFVFEFWRLGYMIKKPGKTRLITFLK